MHLGTMVSVRDFDSLRLPDSDFSELLLFRGDLELLSSDPRLTDRLRAAVPPIRYVHVQEFVESGGIEVLLDLSSEDEGLRRKSVSVVEGTRSLASELGCPEVVVHPGGVRREAVDAKRLTADLTRSLEELGPDSLLLENMPWYYWFRKSERLVSNLCVGIEDVSPFADLMEGLTLDTCHGYLSRAEGDAGYCIRFLDEFGDKVVHIHASDARAPDREGLQIGEGDVDLSFLADMEVPILVEVWDGHADGGRGFRTALERLRSMG